MIKKLIHKVISLAEKTTGRNILIIPNEQKSRMTAVKSDLGFWYSGDVFNKSDIAHGIYRNGVVEPEETKIVLQLLTHIRSEKPFYFYDIGANSGYYGITAAFTGEQKTESFFFEPLAEYVSLINETIDLNSLSSVTNVFPTALGDKNTTAEIQISGSGSSLVPAFLGNTNKLPVREIPVATLDTIVQEKRIPEPDFIKIDVEGFEHQVLLGGLKTITNAHPVLFIEIARSLNSNNQNFSNPNHDAIFDLLTELGYNAFIVQDGLHPVTKSTAADGVFMYLFMHSDTAEHTTFKYNP